MHIVTLLFALGLWTPGILARRPYDAILLSKVKSLTVRDGRQTSHRRIAAVPQLTCVGGNAQGLYDVDVMRCENSGSEYDTEDISWTCKASLPPEFKLGSTDVVCEGYESADDPYVLKGSCAVEYRLSLTLLGEQKYPERLGKKWRSSSGKKGSNMIAEGSDWLAGVLFWLIFGGIVCAILYSIFFGSPGQGNNNPNRRRNRNPRYGGGGGWGGDDNDDPPPPYTPRAPPRGPAKSQTSSSSRTQNQWQPGFWSGAAAGAAAGAVAGYTAGNRNSNRQTRAQAGPSNWFGGGGGSSSSSPQPSSSRQESTGFGSTRRR